MKNKKTTISRRNGFSLIEVMVAVAILGIMTLAMTSFLSNMLKENRRMHQLESTLDLTNDVRSYLGIGTNCSIDYAGVDPTSAASGVTAVTSLPNANPPPPDRYAEGQTYYNGTLKVSEINITNLVRDNTVAPPAATIGSDYYTGTADLVFIIELTGQTGLKVVRKIPLRVQLLGYVAGAGAPNENQINTCTTAPISGGFNPWVIGAGGVIYYNGGKVGIGTATPNFLLEVNGGIGATGFFFTSDQTLKENIQTVAGLPTIKKLRGVSFDWKNNHKPDIGVIAQEVEKVLPQLVSTNQATGIKSVKLANLVAILIEAAKDLHRDNLALKKRVEALESDEP